MDLVVGARRVIVTMEHTTREGKSRLLRDCTLPLTGRRCVDLLITDLAVLEFFDERWVLRECMPGVSVEEVLAATEAGIVVSEDVRFVTNEEPL